MPGRTPHQPSRTAPDRRPSLDDAHLRELLADVRARPDAAFHEHPQAIEAAIAELECEAARRGLQIDGDTVPERTPRALALRLFERALASGDGELLDRMLPCLSVHGLWIAFGRTRELRDAVLRRHGLDGILFFLDCRLLDVARAHERKARIRELALAPGDHEAHVDQCILELFTMLLRARPGEPG